MKKITEAARRKKAWDMIQEISEDAVLSKFPKQRDALDAIYRIAHTMASPGCRKNHAGWVKTIDKAIRAEARRKKA